MEFVSYGTLRSFVQTHHDKLSADPEIQNLFAIASYHIALAMEHLRSKMVSLMFQWNTRDYTHTIFKEWKDALQIEL